MYYKDAHLAIVVYDVTSRASYERAQGWIRELRVSVVTPNIVIAIVGNKVDLVKDNTTARQIKEEEGATYSKEAGLIFSEVSAKTGENVTEIFDNIVNAVPLEMLRALDAPQRIGGDSNRAVRLSESVAKDKSKGGYCC